MSLRCVIRYGRNGSHEQKKKNKPREIDDREVGVCSLYKPGHSTRVKNFFSRFFFPLSVSLSLDISVIGWSRYQLSARVEAQVV